jgi:hypothetical protein
MVHGLPPLPKGVVGKKRAAKPAIPPGENRIMTNNNPPYTNNL